MIQIRNSFLGKLTSVFLAYTFLFQVIFPLKVMALTGGPSPENTGYTPIGLDNMVSTTSGDFSYQVSLMQVGDIPLSINYSAGSSVESEAGVVGLNWSPSWSAINRQMNGIPDEFNGVDKIEKTFFQKPNWTVDLSFAGDIELFTFEIKDGVKKFMEKGKAIKEASDKSDRSLKTNLSVNLSYNNYSGFGMGGNFSQSRKFNYACGLGWSADYSLGLNSKSGISVDGNASASYTKETKKNNSLSGGINTGLGYNSRAGMTAFSMGADLGYTATGKEKEIGKKKLKRTPEASLGIGKPASYSFSAPSFITSYENSRNNANANIGVKTGGTLFGAFGNLSVSGAYSSTWVAKDDREGRKLPAYGFMHAEDAEGVDDALMDFNREKDAGSFNKDIKNLPLAKETYDIYSVSAPGLAGSFRTTRGDIGLIKDVVATCGGGGGGLGGYDFGAGNIADQGINFKGNWSNSNSGEWKDKHNETTNELKYQTKDFDNDKHSDYEPFYFKQAGEFVVESDPDFIQQLGTSGNTKLQISKGSGYANSKLSTSISQTKRNKRDRRNSGFQILTAEQAQHVGLDKKIKYFAKESGKYVEKEVSRVETGDNFSTKYKAHHPSQIDVTGADGKRCVFGIPTYVKTHKEVTYSTEKGGYNTRGEGCSTGIIEYENSEDKVKNNVNDEFYQRNKLPPYANSYLLTGVVGSDYIDKTGDGITDDDFGSATSVRYYKHSDDYGYRTPFEGAYFNEGLKSKEGDDKASYTYGKKEIWYVKEIESRTSIAVFEYTKRSDGYGALEEGGIDKSESLMCLKTISLYSKPEYNTHINDLEKAVPIKVAHFEYDYSSCLGKDKTPLPNNIGGSYDANNNENQGGKLTLKKVYFTYGKSKKGKVSPYIFSYNTNDDFYYGEKSSDRWGVFKENKGTVCDLKSELCNAEFPYTKQDDITDEYAGIWSMSKIETPSGGTIEVVYESDDYAYVQNKRAMQMMNITGFGREHDDHEVDGVHLYRNLPKFSINPASLDKVRATLDKPFIDSFQDVLDLLGSDFVLSALSLTENPTLKKIKEFIDVRPAGTNNYAFFKLQENIPNDLVGVNDSIKKHYLLDESDSQLEHLFFKMLVAVNSPTSIHQGLDVNDKNIYEFIQGYAGIKSCGVNTNKTVVGSDGKTYYTHGYVELEDVTLSEIYGGKINPVSKTAWQFTRTNLQHIAYNQAPDMGEGTGTDHIVGQFTSLLSSIGGLFTGFNQRMHLQGFGKKIRPEKSFVRLYSPTKIKKGGGHRVKKLSIKDNWQNISGSSNYSDAEYGQEYEYTMEESGRIISSGVAQTEPIVGSDENPMKVPDNFEIDKKVLAPDDRVYQEHPFGETFMPAASVVYRQVKVTNILPKDVNVTINATGHVLHENYTAYDFPVKLKKSETSSILYGDKPFGRGTGRALLGLKAMSIEATQSYTIETNNMHGVKKGEKIFNADGSEISSVEYIYKTNPNRDLINTVQTVGKDGNIKTETIGLEIETVVDAKMSESISNCAGLNLNNNNSLYGPIPVILLSLLPKYNRTETASKTAVVVKHVNRLGVLEKTIARDLGSEVETKNILYDRESGQVLLTETQNQFNDPVFNFQYPAYWVYRNMGPSYKNLGYRVINSSVGSLDADKFYVGDELAISTDKTIANGGTAVRYWVTSIDADKVKIKNAKGDLFNTSFEELIVIRSGARNLHATPVGNITSLKSPISGGKLILGQTNTVAYPDYYSSILNASAMEFTNKWDTWCNCEYSDYNEWNVFKNGLWSGWRPKRSYVYLTNRTQSIKNANTNIREDGVFKDFSPFWLLNNSAEKWNKTTSDKWTWVEEISLYSPLSQELERMNALGIFSSSVFGYNRMLPTGVAGNAMYQEIGEDNFEDYKFSDCENDHFSFKKHNTKNSLRRSHTGRHSLLIPKKSSVTVTKIIRKCEKKPDLATED